MHSNLAQLQKFHLFEHGFCYMEYDDTKIVKSRISVFSPGESKVGINTWVLCIARDGPESCCWCVLKV